MPTLAQSPALTVRLESAVLALLQANEVLAAITLRNATQDGQIETPYIVVSANRSGERIHNSGVYDCEVRIHLKTTTGNGPKATDDATLLAIDAAIEAVIFGPSVISLAAAITAQADYLRCDAVQNTTSAPVIFDDTRREIDYTFNAVCLALPEPDEE